MIRRYHGTLNLPVVSVLTASVPERHLLLTENMYSVRAQTYHKWEHLVLVDREGNGCSDTTNRLARKAAGDWLFLLNDDDLMLPGCLAAHIAHATDDIDIVYGPPLVWGEDAAQFCGGFPAVPTTALIRRSLWEKLGGFNTDLKRAEDRDFFIRCSDIATPTVRIDDTPTWIYRFWGGNKSRRSENE